MTNFEHFNPMQTSITDPSDRVIPLTPEDRLWEQAFKASEIGAQAQIHIDELYDDIQAKRASNRYTDKQEADKLEEEYWLRNNHLQELKLVEEKLVSVLEQFEAGELTSEELIQYLPSDDNEVTISKRRRAIQRAKEEGTAVELELFMYGYTHWDRMDVGPGLTTDPRRLATGRNLKKLVANQRLTAQEAHSQFIEATTDTHGGKSRRPGKSGTHYVAASGKRIRKR